MLEKPAGDHRVQALLKHSQPFFNKAEIILDVKDVLFFFYLKVGFFCYYFSNDNTRKAAITVFSSIAICLFLKSQGFIVVVFNASYYCMCYPEDSEDVIPAHNLPSQCGNVEVTVVPYVQPFNFTCCRQGSGDGRLLWFHQFHFSGLPLS